MTSRSNWLRALDPSILCTAVVTGFFYAFVTRPSMHHTLLHRYTTEHMVDYIIVTLYIWGVTDLIFRLRNYPRDIFAFRDKWLPARGPREPAAKAKGYLAELRDRPQWQQDSRIGRRLAQALELVVDKRAGDEYRENLQYLADQDHEQTHANYTLLRFLIGVMPFFGFLGTVVHFGTALSGLSVDQMSSQIHVVVAEMGQAFNTTTIALGAAMTLMFLLFVCERAEQRHVDAIDRLVDRELLNRFETMTTDLGPLARILQAANEEALSGMNSVLEGQTNLWTQSLEALFDRFDHRQQQESQAWQAAIATLENRQQRGETDREQRILEVLSLVEAKHDRFLGQLEGSLEKAFSLRDDFAVLLNTIDRIAHGEGRLVELQASLAENLRVLSETRHIEDAFHGVTAAIHLLTARHSHHSQTNAAA